MIIQSNTINLLNNIFAAIIIGIIAVLIMCKIIKKVCYKNDSNKNKNGNKNKTFDIKINNKTMWIIFTVLLLIALFTRLFRLDELLHGFNCDELGTLFDASNIVKYGCDRYFNILPLYFVNFGGGQSALAVYLCAIFGKIIGFSTILAVRLPNALLNVAAIVAGFFIIKREHGPKSALTFMAIMIFMPWYMMQSRVGLDCNMFAPMFILALIMLLYSKKDWQYLLSGILFGLVLYSYIISIIIIPVFLLLTFIYMFITKKITIRNVIIFLIPFIICAIPIVLVALINTGKIPEISRIINLPKLIYDRDETLGLKTIEGIISNLRRIFVYDEHLYNSIPAFGNTYKFTIPLIILGLILTIKDLVLSLKNRKFELGSLFVFIFIANIPLILYMDVHSGRMQTIFVAVMFFIYLAIKYIYKNTKIGFISIIIMFTVMSIIFTGYYFTRYEKDYPIIKYVDKDLINVVNRVEEIDKDKRVNLRYSTMQPWIYIAYATEVSPFDLMESVHHDSPINRRVNYFEYGRYYVFYETIQDLKDDEIYVLGCIDEINKNEFDEDRQNLKNLRDNNFMEEQIGDYIIFYKNNEKNN